MWHFLVIGFLGWFLVFILCLFTSLIGFWLESEFYGLYMEVKLKNMSTRHDISKEPNSIVFFLKFVAGSSKVKNLVVKLWWWKLRRLNDDICLRILLLQKLVGQYICLVRKWKHNKKEQNLDIYFWCLHNEGILPFFFLPLHVLLDENL